MHTCVLEKTGCRLRTSGGRKEPSESACFEHLPSVCHAIRKEIRTDDLSPDKMAASARGPLPISSLACLVLISLSRASCAEEKDFSRANGRHIQQSSGARGRPGESRDDFPSDDDNTFCTRCPEESGCEVCCCFDGECVDREEAKNGEASCLSDGLLISGDPVTKKECAHCEKEECNYFHWCP